MDDKLTRAMQQYIGEQGGEIKQPLENGFIFTCPAVEDHTGREYKYDRRLTADGETIYLDGKKEWTLREFLTHYQPKQSKTQRPPSFDPNDRSN